MVTRVLVVDDHPVWRSALSDVIASDTSFQVTSQAGSLAEARAMIAQGDVDLIVLDLLLPDGHGQELLELTGESLPILVLTAADSTQAASDALAAGAKGFLSKSSPARDIVAAMASVATGRVALSSSRFLEVMALRQARVGRPVLSPAELEVLTLMNSGVTSTNDMAAQLFIAPRTVKSRLTGVYAKLGVRDRQEALREARRLGYVPQDRRRRALGS